ncbi:MAG: hypothetical protein JWP02_3378 [Acidimicrobiales bacterium]|nr:hypothetical protein [Acidimicrobiales bacterium]
MAVGIVIRRSEGVEVLDDVAPAPDGFGPEAGAVIVIQRSWPGLYIPAMAAMPGGGGDGFSPGPRTSMLCIMPSSS